MEETLNNQAGQNFKEESRNNSNQVSKDARMWAMFCHLAALTGFGIWFLGFIVGPLIIWLIKKDEFPFVNEHGKEAVNFQISMMIYAIVSAFLFLVGIGFLLLSAVFIVDLIFLIIAAIKANNGEHYRYPLTIRFIQ